MAKAQGDLVAVESTTHGTRKLTRIMPYSDGGFGVLMPYHDDNVGYLMKHPVHNEMGTHWRPISELTEYQASDRVKLSIHRDGFAQFSSERANNILSGRDEAGVPKGLGVLSQPLDRPINTGPTFGIVAWGIDRFHEARVGSAPGVLFREADMPARNANELPQPAMLLEGFVFRRDRLWKHVYHDVSLGGPALKLFMRTYQIPTTFTFRVVELHANSPAFLGISMSRTSVQMPSPSGFWLSGPTDMKNGIAAAYPSPTERQLGASLDYSPTKPTS